MTYYVDVYGELARHDGYKPPMTLGDIRILIDLGFEIKWTDYNGYMFAAVVFDDLTEAIEFKLTYL